MHASPKSSGSDVIVVLQPCNPAVGGPAKSQLVHEVDALGGIIGKMADRCYLQKRVLNRSKVSLLIRKMHAPLPYVAPFLCKSPPVIAWVRAASTGAVSKHSVFLCAALRGPAWKALMHHSTVSMGPFLSAAA